MGQLRILIIDDDEGCRHTAARAFTLNSGHIVYGAATGTEGLAKAGELLPDVILLDMVMPDLRGTQVLAALEKNSATRGIPVIIFTGSDVQDEELLELKKLSNFRFIETKPASFTPLLERIEGFFSGRTPGRGIDGRAMDVAA